MKQDARSQRRQHRAFLWGLVSNPGVSKRSAKRDRRHLPVCSLHITDGPASGYWHWGGKNTVIEPRHQNCIVSLNVGQLVNKQGQRYCVKESMESVHWYTCLNTCQHSWGSKRMSARDWPLFSLSCYVNGIRRLNLYHLRSTHWNMKGLKQTDSNVSFRHHQGSNRGAYKHYTRYRFG